jgi:hypothetical protein
MNRAIVQTARLAVRPRVVAATGRVAVPRRFMASPPAVAEVAAPKDVNVAVPKPSSSTSSSSASSAAPAATTVVHHTGSSSWSRFVAFLTGVGVSSIWFYYTISTDVWHSTAVIENSLVDFRKDMAATNRELRSRIATLEHQVAALKK